VKRNLLSIAIVFLCVISTNVQSGQATQQLGVCLTDSLTGKERKNLAKWVFFAISAHPDMSMYAQVPDDSRNQTDQFVGSVVTRLMAEDCPQETKAALQADGRVAIEVAFRLVGQAAMQELMTNGDVNVAISRFEKYLDREKLATIHQ
jgi:hypothetical protein